MKLAIYGAVALTLLGGGVFFLTGKGGSSTGKATIADVSVLNTDVFLKKTTDTDFSKIEKETKASSGDTIKTSSDGRAVINEDGTITSLDYDSKITIKELNGSNSKIALQSGSLWARVEKVFGQGEYYEIETQNAVAVVRGTSFGVNFRNGKSEVLTAEGSVSLIPKDEDGNRLLDKAENIEANKKGVVQNLTVSTSDLTDLDKKSDWFILNTSTIPSEQKKMEAVMETKTEVKIETKTTVSPVEIKTVEPTVQVPGIKIDSINPTKMVLNSLNAQTIVVKGSGFSKVNSIVVGKLTIPPSYVTIKSDNQIEIRIDPSFSFTGTFPVTLVGLSGEVITIPQQITIEAGADTGSIKTDTGYIKTR